PVGADGFVPRQDNPSVIAMEAAGRLKQSTPMWKANGLSHSAWIASFRFASFAMTAVHLSLRWGPQADGSHLRWREPHQQPFTIVIADRRGWLRSSP
ncbi:MAG: hypothetical protein ACYC3P_12910, partial [Bellilinea sp.]